MPDHARAKAPPLVRIPLARLWILCAAFATLAGMARAQNTGNTSFKDVGIAVSSHPSAMKHSTDEMIDYIEDHIDPQVAAQLRSATDPQTGTIRVVELVSPAARGGYSDGGTIAVVTDGTPLWKCSVVLMHEFVHALNAQACDPGNPNAGDCVTNSGVQPTCGACEHARIKADDIDHLGRIACEWMAWTAPEELASVCAAVRESWRDAQQKLEECARDGCDPASIPSIYAIAQVPPCCN